MTTETIAKVVADLKSRRVARTVEPKLAGLALDLVTNPVVVDCTGIYHSLLAKGEPVHLYEDHPSIAPPWEESAFCYENEHGNVIVMHSVAIELPGTGRSPEERKIQWEDTAEPVDWNRVRWCIDVFVWAGGFSHGTTVPTHGPRHMWQFAVYDDGQPADLRWVHLVKEYPMQHWDMAHMVILGALNFLSCSNVDIAEATLPRSARRRMERTGVQVHTINVYPPGSSRTNRASGVPLEGQPLKSVRGHFARYGEQHNRGLLFGKLAGKFWIPARAKAEETDYRLKPQ